MSKCDVCKKEMMEADGCVKRWYDYTDGTKMAAMVYGDSGEDIEIGLSPEDRCHDCNCKVGHYHHFGCDMERCPKCRGQLISCGCKMEGEEE